MKTKKIRSVKQASFFGMIGGSLVFLIINFFIFSVFLLTFAYLFVSHQQDNLSKVLVSNLHEKNERIMSTASTLADIIANDDGKGQKEMYLDSSIVDFKDIEGILILNKQGIVTDTSKTYREYLGIDLSGRDYYKDLVRGENKKTFISNSYVSSKTKKLSLNVVSPILKNNELLGMVVVLISPNIIENKEIKDMHYYLVSTNGDVIFQSDEGNLIAKEDNIKNSLIMQSGYGKANSLLYKDKLTDEYVMGIIRTEPASAMNIIVQFDLFGNRLFMKSLFAVFGIALIIIMLFILIISVQASSTFTDYINIFKNEVSRIASGDYDIKLTNKYPHEEINEIIDNFNGMAHKIKQREEELQAYNEELVAAHDEIKSMLYTLSKAEKDRKDQYLQIIWTMVNLLEIKDEYTAGHSKSVTYYAEQITERLNNNYSFKLDVEKVQIAAILHDIGKIGIERNILNKPARLARDEYELIKTHPGKGYYALKDIESLSEERRIIKYHHERFDGTGYPEGIKGDAIPIGARIICVADAFDAMVSNRPYRRGMSIEMAIEELIKNKGTQFDPLVVDVFVALLRSEQQEECQIEA